MCRQNGCHKAAVKRLLLTTLFSTRSSRGPSNRSFGGWAVRRGPLPKLRSMRHGLGSQPMALDQIFGWCGTWTSGPSWPTQRTGPDRAATGPNMKSGPYPSHAPRLSWYHAPSSWPCTMPCPLLVASQLQLLVAWPALLPILSQR